MSLLFFYEVINNIWLSSLLIYFQVLSTLSPLHYLQLLLNTSYLKNLSSWDLQDVVQLWSFYILSNLFHSLLFLWFHLRQSKHIALSLQGSCLLCSPRLSLYPSSYSTLSPVRLYVSPQPGMPSVHRWLLISSCSKAVLVISRSACPTTYWSSPCTSIFHTQCMANYTHLKNTFS